MKNSLKYEEVNLCLPNVAEVVLVQLSIWILENFGLFNLINDLCVGWEVVVLRDFNSPSVKWSNVLVQGESIGLTDQLLLDCFAACTTE